MPDESTIPVVSPSGEYGTVPESQMANYGALGYRQATQQDTQNQIIKEQYPDNVENRLKAAGLGAIESVPFVGGAIEKATGISPEERSALSSRFEGSKLLGGAAGIAAQSLIPAGPLAEISGASKGIVRSLGIGGPAILKGIAEKGLGSALETGLFTAGHVINEATLGDPSLITQKAISQIGMGALIGGATGSVFGLAKGLKSIESAAMEDAAASEAPMGVSGLAKEAFLKTHPHADLAAGIIGKMQDGIPGLDAAADLLGLSKEKMAAYSFLRPIEDLAVKATKMINGASDAIFAPVDAALNEKTIPLIAESFMTKEDAENHFNKIKESLEPMQNLETANKVLAGNTEQLSPYAPNIAANVQSTTVRALGLLNQAMPKPNGPQAPLAEWTPSVKQIADFNTTYGAINSPISLLGHIRQGTLTGNMVQAVKTVHPELYNHMVATVVPKIAQNSKVIPYQTRQQLSTFLGSDLDGTHNPAKMMAQQAVFGGSSQQSDRQGQPVRATQKGLDKLKVAGRILTPMQRSAQRDLAE